MGDGGRNLALLRASHLGINIDYFTPGILRGVGLVCDRFREECSTEDFGSLLVTFLGVVVLY